MSTEIKPIAIADLDRIVEVAAEDLLVIGKADGAKSFAIRYDKFMEKLQAGGENLATSNLFQTDQTRIYTVPENGMLTFRHVGHTKSGVKVTNNLSMWGNEINAISLQSNRDDGTGLLPHSRLMLYPDQLLLESEYIVLSGLKESDSAGKMMVVVDGNGITSKVPIVNGVSTTGTNAHVQIGGGISLESEQDYTNVIIKNLPQNDDLANVLKVDESGTMYRGTLDAGSGTNLATSDLVQEEEVRIYNVCQYATAPQKNNKGLIAMPPAGVLKFYDYASDGPAEKLGPLMSIGREGADQIVDSNIYGSIKIGRQEKSSIELLSDKVFAPNVPSEHDVLTLPAAYNLKIDENGRIVKSASNGGGGGNLANSDLVQTDSHREYQIKDQLRFQANGAPMMVLRDDGEINTTPWEYKPRYTIEIGNVEANNWGQIDNEKQQSKTILKSGQIQLPNISASWPQEALGIDYEGNVVKYPMNPNMDIWIEERMVSGFTEVYFDNRFYRLTTDSNVTLNINVNAYKPYSEYAIFLTIQNGGSATLQAQWQNLYQGGDALNSDGEYMIKFYYMQVGNGEIRAVVTKMN